MQTHGLYEVIDVLDFFDIIDLRHVLQRIVRCLIYSFVYWEMSKNQEQ